MRLGIALFACLFLCSPALADEFDGTPTLSADDKAQIQADQEEAKKKIDEKYKGDDSPEARAAMQREYQDAHEKVLEKHGMTEKEYMWQTSHEAPDEQQEIREKSKAIEAKRKADAEAAKSKPAPAGPEVVKGFDENHPLDVTPGSEKPKLDANGNPVPTVEKLDPADDPNAGIAVPPERPTRHTRSHRRHHR